MDRDPYHVHTCIWPIPSRHDIQFTLPFRAVWDITVVHSVRHQLEFRVVAVSDSICTGPRLRPSTLRPEGITSDCISLTGRQDTGRVELGHTTTDSQIIGSFAARLQLIVGSSVRQQLSAGSLRCIVGPPRHTAISLSCTFGVELAQSAPHAVLVAAIPIHQHHTPSDITRQSEPRH